MIDYDSVKKLLNKYSFQIGVYLVWLLVHLTHLLVFSDGPFSSSNHNSGIDDFWPISDAESYDVTEFIFYSFGPFLIYTGVLLLAENGVLMWFKSQKLKKVLIVVGACLSIFIGVVLLIDQIYSSKKVVFTPYKVTEYQGVKLGMSREDVLFIKGEPKESKKDSLLYENKFSDQKVFVNFDDKMVVDVVACEGKYCGLLDIDIGNSSEMMVGKLGDPDSIQSENEGLQRIYVYHRYNACFVLEKDRVVGVAVFQ